ncbi:MAG: DUF3301 domain-containing protein [Thiotrichales bacterium]
MKHLIIIALLGLGFWFWLNNLRARELAIKIGAESCKSLAVQFLDDTVSINRMGVGREPEGYLSLQRVYRFEFSVDGVERREGRVAMQGMRIKAVHLDHPDGPIVMQPRLES